MRNADEFDSRRRLWQKPVGAAISAILSSCTNFGRRTAVPLSERRDAIALGLRNARFFLDEPGAISAEQELALVREAKSLDVSRGGALQTRSTYHFREAEIRAPLALDCSSVGPRMATVRNSNSSPE